MEQSKNVSKGQVATPFAQTYFHGTRVALNLGDLIELVSIRIVVKEKMRNTFS